MATVPINGGLAAQQTANVTDPDFSSPAIGTEPKPEASVTSPDFVAHFAFPTSADWPAEASQGSNPALGSVDAKDVKYQKQDGHLFVGDDGKVNDGAGISPKDISQGQLGDCYFLSSLAAVAKQHPETIKNMVHDNGDGTYTVTFHEKGWFGGYHDVKETVNADLPVKDGHLAFAQSGNQASDGKPELWVPIVEKAYAKYKGSYHNAEGGWSKNALPLISGADSTSFKPSDLSFADFAKQFKQGNAVTLESRDAGKDILWFHVGDHPQNDPYYKDGKLVTNHTYYVVGVDEQKQTVQVKNPWGWSANPQTEIPYSDLQRVFQKVVVNPAH